MKKHSKLLTIKCKNCYSTFLRYKSMIGKYNFCSPKCRYKYFVNKRYHHLKKTFNNKNLDEISYLFGLILGDGHLRKLEQKTTTRICIAFNNKEKYLIKQAIKILNKLKIKHCIAKVYHNCQVIGFVLPDYILKKYNMLWVGNKYNAQPKPKILILKNINFVTGLINSDGCCRRRYKNNLEYTINNTVYSIIQSIEKCLKYNKINFRTRLRKPTIDKRTLNKCKVNWNVYISKKK